MNNNKLSSANTIGYYEKKEFLNNDIVSNINLNFIKQFYLYFNIGQDTEFSVFDDEENLYFNNEHLFINIFDEIPNQFDDYNQIINTIDNQQDKKTIIIFTLIDLFIKFYNSKPDKFYNLYFELNKINKLKKQDNNENEEENTEESDDEEEDIEKISYEFYYDLLKKLLNIIENYFRFYHYVQDKDEYFTNLTNIIFGNDYITNDFKLFIKNMNFFIDKFKDELDTTQYIFDYLVKLKNIYDMQPKQNGGKRKYKLKLK
jgi:hypothetical protein